MKSSRSLERKPDLSIQSCQNDYLFAKKLISDMENWLEKTVDVFEKFSEEQKNDLLHEIEQARINLHVFEHLIVIRGGGNTITNN